MMLTISDVIVATIAVTCIAVGKLLPVNCGLNMNHGMLLTIDGVWMIDKVVMSAV
ncbi:hypothetical protein [Neptunicella sp.]|uniref:hypothetical protein n=1 Tax=Neptunicella sp. TaxID=2125986 RepID=UPI003F694BA3